MARQEDLGDLKLYRLPEPVTVAAYGQKQVAFLQRPAVPVELVYRQRLDQLVDEVPCSACRGSRLRADAAATRFAGLTLGELGAKPLGDTLRHVAGLDLTKYDQQVAGEVLREIRSRLTFLVDVGLDYLALSRPGPTLSRRGRGSRRPTSTSTPSPPGRWATSSTPSATGSGTCRPTAPRSR